MAYGEALLHEKDPQRAEKAEQILREHLLRNDDDPLLYELYARASDYSGNEIRASEAIAESYYLRGQVHEAAMQLSRLAEKSDLSYYQRARITARLDEMRRKMIELGEDPAQG